MNDLDSRTLRYCDSFTQRFANPGALSYALGPAGTTQFGAQEAFKITVKQVAANRKAKQHFVVVRLKDKHLVADPPDLDIEAGDLVLWSAESAGTPPFRVGGRSEAWAFDSDGLQSEAVYSHAFGVAGEYRWRDANGHGVSGVVKVTNPVVKVRGDTEKFHNLLGKGTMVLIRGQQAEPNTVEIFTGQTVFFAVEKAAGITITDERLIRRD